METPNPPNDTPGALKQVVLTPHDIPWSLREIQFWSGAIHSSDPIKSQAPKRRSRPYTREIACEQRLGVDGDGDPGKAVESFF